jgi:diaminopimelate epimerase
MDLEFYKYQGTGNDFIIIDNRNALFDAQNKTLINSLCDRKFGIGADGLILLEDSKTTNFNMVYFNADGSESSMCGNGGRCIVAFAKKLGIIDTKAIFNAIDGSHHATINGDSVNLQMQNISSVSEFKTHLFLDTGSPHHVEFCHAVDDINVKTKGKAIRNGKPYGDVGTNVNFAEQIKNNIFKVRTYERGVEDETLSCGTGVTAVAIAAHKSGLTKDNTIILETLGGVLNISFDVENGIYSKIYLKGSTKLVFKGIFTI